MSGHGSTPSRVGPDDSEERDEPFLAKIRFISRKGNEMNLKRTVAFTIAIYATICLAQASTFWLHVRVQEKGKTESVKVNVPVSLIETVLPIIEDHQLEAGKIHLENQELTVQEIREIWQQVQSQGNYELASIDSDDSRVRVALEGNDLIVRSTEGSDTEVMVKVPKSVVDALLSGEGNQLNLMAAVGVLKTMGAQELVNITDDETFVRIWIDESSASE